MKKIVKKGKPDKKLKKPYLKEQALNSIDNQLIRWAYCSALDLANCFESFCEKERQFKRFCAIEYGVISEDLRNFIISACKEQKKGPRRTKYLNMSLGVFKEENGDDVFNIIFETQQIKGKMSEKGYYVSVGDKSTFPKPMTSTARVNNTPFNINLPIHEIYGLQPVVPKHLCSAWEFTSLEKLLKLFMVEMTAKGYAAMSVNNPLSREPVRTLKFPINGYDLAVLGILMDKNEKAELTVRFGSNTSEHYYDDAAFSPIIEIKVPTESNSFEGEKLKWEDKKAGILTEAFKVEKELVKKDFSLDDCEIVEEGIYIHESRHAHWHHKIKFRITLDKLVIIDDEIFETTSLDFVHACPPLCDPPRTGTGD